MWHIHIIRICRKTFGMIRIKCFERWLVIMEVMVMVMVTRVKVTMVEVREWRGQGRQVLQVVQPEIVKILSLMPELEMEFLTI